MHKPGNEKRNAIIIGSVMAVLTVMVGVALTRRPVVIMPPEPDETVRMRKSPDNAYYILQEAIALMHDSPPPPMAVENGGALYAPEPDSWGRAYNVYLPDNNAQFVEYRKQCGIAVQKTREAMAKPYYLHPEIGTEDTPYLNVSRLYELARALIAPGLHRLWREGDSGAAFAGLVDSLRLGRMIASDGPLTAYLCASSIQHDTLRQMGDVIQLSNNMVELRRAMHKLHALADNPLTLSTRLAFEWRREDNSVHLRKPVSAAERDPGGDPTAAFLQEIGRMLFIDNVGGHYMKLRESWQRKRIRKTLRSNRDDILRAADMPYPEFETWRHEHPRLLYWQPLLWMQGHRADLDARYRGTVLTIALRLYELERGRYPDKLDALVPDQLDTIPLDPFSDEPFIYHLVNDDYLLYAIGRNGRNDGGKDDDTVIHRPADGPIRSESV